MPTAPKRLGAPASGAKRMEYRGNSHARGYDYRWTRLRARFIKQHPLCQDCLEDNITNCEQLEVDHVVPFNGKYDPLRLDWSNLRTRCKKHHRIKTLKDQG